MNIVLDTNVIVSGLLSPFGAPAEIIQMVSSGIVRLCYDARILSEYRDVLRRPKFRFDETHVDPFLNQVKVDGYWVTAKPLAKRLPDPDDEPFLEVALAAKARCLITGNPKDYPVPKREGVAVISPSKFLEKYRGQL